MQVTVQKTISKPLPTSVELDGYAVPAGTLTINQWQVGTQYDNKSSLKAALYWDESGEGDDSTWQRIASAYTSRTTYTRNFTAYNSFISNGQSKIWVRQWLDGDGRRPRQTFVRWTGTTS